QLGRPGGDVPLPLRVRGRPAGARQRPGRHDVELPDRAARGQRAREGAVPHRRGAPARVRQARGRHPARARQRARLRRGRGRGVRVHRRHAAHRLAAPRRAARPAGLRALGRGPAGRARPGPSRAGLARDERARGVRRRRRQAPVGEAHSLGGGRGRDGRAGRPPPPGGGLVRAGPAAARRVDALSGVPLCAALDDQHLADLLNRAEEVHARAGQVLFREGDVGDHLYVVLSGELVISRRVREVDDVIAYRGPGEVVGEMALVNGRPRTATVRANQDSVLLRLGQRAFRELLGRSPEAAAAIVSCMAARIEEEQANRAREERLLALGTMAAGLAHELSNPASALVRSTAALAAAHERRDAAALDLFGRDLGPDELQAVLTLGLLAKERAESSPHGPGHLPDPDEEDELADHLQALGLERPWDAAPALLQAGWTLPALEEVLAPFAAENRAAAARWLAADAVARGLLA